MSLLRTTMFLGVSMTAVCLAGAERAFVTARGGGRPTPIVAIAHVCAWPNLTVLPDGTIVATIHNQPSHLMQPGDVECWASGDGGLTWTKRGTPAPRDAENASRGMFAAGLAGNGHLVILTTGHMPVGPDHGPVTATWVSRSADGGRTWTIDKDGFPRGPLGDVLNPFGDILEGADGALRVAVYGAKAGTYVYRSDDHGEKWRAPVRLSGEKRDETGLFHLGGGKWLAAARSNGLDLYASDDDAKTWTHRKKLTGPQQHPGHIMRLADRRLLLTYGNRLDPKGIDVRLSADEGQTWTGPLRVTDFQGDGGYPSSIQLPDGQVLTEISSSTGPAASRTSCPNRFRKEHRPTDRTRALADGGLS